MAKIYKRIKKSEIKKLFKDGKEFNGFLVGCNVKEFHFFDGWYLACEITADSLESFEKQVANWSYYNTNTQTGRYCHYYIYTNM